MNLPTYNGDLNRFLNRQLLSNEQNDLNSAFGFGGDRTNYEFQSGGNIYRVGNNNNGTRSVSLIGDVASRQAQRQKEEQAALIAKQKAEQGAFLNRYKTGINEARTALNSELGLDTLRQGTQTAGQTARDVSRQVQDVAPTQQTIAKQVGISAPRLQTRIAAETTKMAPALEAARRSLEDATAAQQFGETQYTERLKEFTQPFTLEASMLSESLAREFTGFSQLLENELTVILKKLDQGFQLSMAEMKRAQDLADKETEFEKTKQLYSFQQDTDLTNSIKQEQLLKQFGLGSYYQKPKTGSGTDSLGIR